jgi:hypothetical protein
MAEDPMRAKARTTFGKAFMDAAKPRPLAKDAATASQKVANQRPIPTYKVGGVVKKADGGVMPGRIAARIKAGNYKDGGETFDYNKGGKVQTSADTARKLATEMGGMKKGGACGMKPVKKAVGGTATPLKDASAKTSGLPGTSGVQLAAKTPVNRAVGGAGKTRKDQAPIKRAHGGVAKKDTMPREGVSTRPTGPGGRRITFEELEQSNRDTGGMSAEQLRAAGRAIGRGNRTPKEPIPRAKGGAAKVRKGMMTEKGDIKQAVKPKKGIGGFM